MPREFIGYRFAARRSPLDADEAEITGAFYDYVFGRDGIYVVAERRGLRVCIPRLTGANDTVKGLPPVEPSVRFDYPPVPAHMVERIVTRSREEAAAGVGRETLFHLWYDEEAAWIMREPPQSRTRTSVRPTDDGADSSYARALIEVHSHATMPAFYSETDDRDEQGFRLYGVVGNFGRAGERPQLLLRVGVYGAFYLIPAGWIFDLSESLVCDVTAEEWAAAEKRENDERAKQERRAAS